MARILLFVLLLLAGWALIFLPLVSQPQGIHWPFSAHPSASLPQPWQSGVVVQVSAQPVSTTADQDDQAGGAGCPVELTLQRGETLGQLARRCGVPLSSLLAANPQIEDPNRVNAGQVLHIPLLAGRGGGSTLAGGTGAAFVSGDFLPGSTVQVQAAGLPPRARVRIGIGLSSSGYHVLQNAVADGQGGLDVALRIPPDAQPGDRAFILLTGLGLPSFQAISPEFSLAHP